MNPRKRVCSLNGEWLLREVGSENLYEATVPGCVHQDLMNAGAIKDLYGGKNELEYLWVGERVWDYERSFELDSAFLEANRLFLRCDGLDTLATLFINGKEVARTDNMFRTYEIDVDEFLLVGENSIRIRFESPLPYMGQKNAEKKLACWNEVYGIEGRGYLRKAAYNFGWDWGPVTVSCGIWRNIELVSVGAGRIREVYVRQNHELPSKVGLTFSAGSPSEDGSTLKIAISKDGHSVARTSCNITDSKAFAYVEVQKPELWWPNGMGVPTLYDCRVALLDSNGMEIDVWERRIGFRTIVLKREGDQWGESFQFEVNGIPVFAKGANWIPVDPYPGNGDESRTRALLEDSAEAHMNMIRVWGGGYYPNDHFFETCDELGLLVWQDAMFACGTYPLGDEDFVQNVRYEVRDQVRRIQHHACLALWCGNNEMEQAMGGDPSWIESCDWDTYKKFFDQTLPKAIAAQDPQTPYWPSSPHTPSDVDPRKAAQDPESGDAHVWTVWFEDVPFEKYLESNHRFNSEFGFQSYPSLDTVMSFAETDDLSFNSEVMAFHQRSPVGNQMIMRQLRDWFVEPESFESFIYLSQVLQSLAIETGVSHWRRNMPRTMGTLYWQLNDVWPAVTWSSIDSCGRWKALHYAAKRFFAHFTVSGVVSADKSKLSLWACNDYLTAIDADVEVSMTNPSGVVLDRWKYKAQVDGGNASELAVLDISAHLEEKSSHELLFWISYESSKGCVGDSLCLLERPKSIGLLQSDLIVLAMEGDGGVRIELESDSVALWVWLSCGDLRFEDNSFHLRKGIRKSIRITDTKGYSLARIKETLSVRSLMDSYESEVSTSQ